MNWWGKLVGSGVGFLMGGPLGAMLGAAIGHNFDASFRRFYGEAARSETKARMQAVFVETACQVMGYVAKQDGRVSENEVALARALMTQLETHPGQLQELIALFQEGKQPDFNLEAALSRFSHHCGNRPHLIRQFVEVQLTMAYADGPPQPAKRAVLLFICARVGFSRLHLETLETNLRNRQQKGGAQRDNHGRERRHTRHLNTLDTAYATLGLEREASDEEVKLAYRRLINRHHPDKLAAHGIGPEALKEATEKTREIKAAYERVKEARGF